MSDGSPTRQSNAKVWQVQMAKKKLGGAEAVNVVNKDGQIVRTYGPDESDERSDFVAKAEEFVAKQNAKGADYRIEPAKASKKSANEDADTDTEDSDDE